MSQSQDWAFQAPIRTFVRTAGGGVAPAPAGASNVDGAAMRGTGGVSPSMGAVVDSFIDAVLIGRTPSHPRLCMRKVALAHAPPDRVALLLEALLHSASTLTGP